jgi:hypothetical protein
VRSVASITRSIFSRPVNSTVATPLVVVAVTLVKRAASIPSVDADRAIIAIERRGDARLRVLAGEVQPSADLGNGFIDGHRGLCC